MTSQVVFKLDKKLKDRAMSKAQKEGVTFSSILKLATKAFVEGDLNIGLVNSERFNNAAQKEIGKTLKDIKAGKNLSGTFKTAAEAIRYLKS